MTLLKVSVNWWASTIDWLAERCLDPMFRTQFDPADCRFTHASVMDRNYDSTPVRCWGRRRITNYLNLGIFPSERIKNEYQRDRNTSDCRH